MLNLETRLRVLNDIDHERNNQIAQWGDQRHLLDGTTSDYTDRSNFYRMRCNQRFADGEGTWLDILLEEVYEAAAETDKMRLRKELVQIAAVAAAWIEEGIDDRPARR